MRKSIYIALFASIFVMDSLTADAGRGNDNGKKSLRASFSRKQRFGNVAKKVATSSVSTESASKSKEETDISMEEKTVKTCEKIFYKCMDEKTNESVMSNDIVYNDYADMISDIYSGNSPAFKCIYSNNLKSLYAKYYFGREISAPMNGHMEKVRSNSIEYYNYLKNNATQVASKKASVDKIDSEVLDILGIKKTLNMSQILPDVSYTITTIDGTALLDENVAYCSDASRNKDYEGCDKMKKSWVDNYKEENPSMLKSCKDYEVFLSSKLTQAKSSTNDYILKLGKKIESVIKEYELKKTAEEELKKLEEEEKSSQKFKGLKDIFKK